MGTWLVSIIFIQIISASTLSDNSSTGPPRGGGGNWGILPWAPLCLWAPKRLIYSNRTVKYSIKAVTTYFYPGPCKLSGLP